MAAVTLHHPDLGSITGVQGDEVHQFFGIQFATLKDRLATPELKTNYQSPIDGSKFG